LQASFSPLGKTTNSSWGESVVHFFTLLPMAAR